MLERAQAAGSGRSDGVPHTSLEIPCDSLGVATPACFARGRGREQDSRCPTNASQRNEIAAPHSHAYDYRRADGYASLPIPRRSVRFNMQDHGWPSRSAGCLERSGQGPAGHACRSIDGPAGGGRQDRASSRRGAAQRASRETGRKTAFSEQAVRQARTEGRRRPELPSMRECANAP